MNTSKQVARGAIISYLTIGFNVIAGLIYTPWMIETIGKEQYALYTLAISVINLFLMDFGIGSAVSKFLTKFYAQGKQEEANYFMGTVYRIFFVISACIAALLFIFFFFLENVYSSLTPQEMSVFKTLYIIVAAYSVFSFPCTTFNGILMANERFTAVKVISLTYKLFEIACICLLLHLNFGVYALVVVHAVSNVIFHGIRYSVIRFQTKQRTKFSAWNKKQATEIFDVSIWVTIMSIAKRCVFNIMPTILSALVGSAEIAYFSLASTIEGYVYVFSEAINGMFMPKITRILHRDNSAAALNNLLQKVAKYHIYTLGLIAIEFICFGKHFVTMWLGEGYDTVYRCAVFLILPSLIERPQQVARTSLLVLDVIKQQALIYVMMGVVCLGAAVLLVPHMGAVGAGLAILICYLFRTVCFNILYHKKTPILVWQYFKGTYSKWIWAAGLALLIGLCIESRFVTMSVWEFLICASIVGCVYLLAVFVIDIDKNTKQMLYKKITSLRSKHK